MQVTLKDITFSYDQIYKTFTHLNWVIPDGKLVDLLGPSGSGKTSILNLVAGLLTPSNISTHQHTGTKTAILSRIF
ncbi:ATP-binding cassette domain-containing protein [Pediococcus ethanolidurans]|nr:ATP-binding cassette domain-containing protein [Pediococcus ethanolidurans]